METAKNQAIAPKNYTGPFVNLYKQYFKELKKRRESLLKGLKEHNTIEDLKKYAYYRDQLTPKQWAKVTTYSQAKKLILEAFNKEWNKGAAKCAEVLNRVNQAPDMQTLKVSIEWKANRTWGSNPTAEATFSGGHFERTSSGSIGGCGYDKQSTAFARAVNHSDIFLKAIFTLVDNGKYKRFKKHGRKSELYGLNTGIGRGWAPYLSGGVGLSCYPDIFEAMGYKFTTVANGKNFDAYLIERK